MSHIGTKDNDWANFSPREKDVDLFHCKKCDVEFSLESDKIEGKMVCCPVCLIHIEPWQKRWNP